MGAFALRRPLALTFLDRKLEADYRRREFDANQRWTSAMMICASILAAAFAPVDKFLVPADVVAITTAMRLVVVTPIPLIGVVANWLLRHHLFARDLFMACGLVVIGAIWTLLIAIGGPASVPYHTVAMIHTLLIAFFLLDVPFRFAVPAGLIVTVPFIVGVWMIDTTLDRSLLAYGGIPAVLLISTGALYRYESLSRDQFIAERQSQIDVGARLAAEADRRRWLELFAGFLRHELRNAIAGIGSSLELLRRIVAEPPGAEYVDRAARSLQFMRRMLQQVAEATTLEAALKRADREVVDLSALVRERIRDFRAEDAGTTVVESVAPELHVRGNADSLVQLVDKLLNNAAEHCDGSEPIRVRGWRHDSEIVLEIEDEGDELPGDPERLFDPFVSAKARSGSGNLGLGLYVARAVATHHGGSIEALPLANARGARLVVRLPAWSDVAISQSVLT